jgi:uncharacterized protein
MNRDILLKEAEKFVRVRVNRYDSGHDWWHIARVRALASYINEKENLADPFIVDLAALFHDMADSKFMGEENEAGYRNVNEFLVNAGLEDISLRITGIMRNVSFSTKNQSGNVNDPVLLIIQDADRLDAIGAIGIARAFNYGGFRNNPIYKPDAEQNKSSTINHFYEKLLLLKSMMNTATGKEMANERHEFLEIFLKQFFKEWNPAVF